MTTIDARDRLRIGRAIAVAVAVVTCGAASSALGQTTLWEWSGNYSRFGSFGTAAVAAPDCDGDGVGDVLVDSGISAMTTPEQLFLYSGRTGALLTTFDLGVEYVAVPSIVGLGDVNRDGFGDVAVGEPVFNRVRIFSGRDGARIRSLHAGLSGGEFGQSLDTIADLDGDGVRDLIVGAPSFKKNGKAYIYSSATGALLRSFDGFDAFGAGGWTVAGSGDVDGDGIPDWIASAVNGGPHGMGTVHVLSGADGHQIRRFDGPGIHGNSINFGGFVAADRDVDGDGVDDLAVSGYTANGEVWLYSGSSGALLQDWTPATPEYFGAPVRFTADVDGDGIADVAIGASAGSATGRVYLYSGVTGALLRTVDGANPGGVIVLDAGGDFDNDGLGDLLLTEVQAPTASLVRTLSLTDAPRILTIAPERGRFDAVQSMTITGSNFTKGSNVAVSFAGVPATNVNVASDTLLTCDRPLAALPGAEVVTGSSSLGARDFVPGFLATPVVTRDGFPFLGQTVELHFLLEPGDDTLGIVGLGPPLTIPTPPYVGDLGVLPFRILFLFPDWISDSVDLKLDIPDDPALAGLTLEFQQLSGPAISGRGKSAAWSNVEELAIR